MPKLLQQIKSSFARERSLFALLKIIRYGYYLLRSLPLRLSLKAPGLYIGPHFLLLGTKHLHIGRDFYAHSNLWIEAIPHYKGIDFQPEINIGDRVAMGDSVHLSCNHRLHIGNDVLFGSNIFVGDHQHGVYRGQQDACSPDLAPAKRHLSKGDGIIIGDRVWIGNNVTIVGSLKIGAGAVIAANSVVTQHVEEGVVVGGVPATTLRIYDQSSHQWIRP
jgi:acetyltransferase-like isoleucine patch superfamily enzyme